MRYGKASQSSDRRLDRVIHFEFVGIQELVGLVGFDRSERLVPVRRLDHAVAGGFAQVPDQGPGVLVVVHHQHLPAEGALRGGHDQSPRALLSKRVYSGMKMRSSSSRSICHQRRNRPISTGCPGRHRSRYS